MKPKQLMSFLSTALRIRKPVLIVGAPGIGKTEIGLAAAREAGMSVIVSHPVISDPTDFKGLPYAKPDADVATFLPYDELADALRAKEPTAWVIDDIGQAPNAVQAALMQLLLARRINGKRLPDCVTFLAMTNRRQDRAGVTGLLEPVKSRFATIIELETDVDAVCAIAAERKWHPTVPAFLRLRPELLHRFEPTADMTNSPCPRSWSNVSAWMNANVPRAMLHEVMAGAVGGAAAGEFVAFVDMLSELPHPDQIILDPLNAPLPSSPSLMFAVASALASLATEANFAAIFKYAKRLPEEYAVYLCRDAQRRNPGVTASPAWMEYVTGALGRLVMGDTSNA